MLGNADFHHGNPCGHCHRPDQIVSNVYYTCSSPLVQAFDFGAYLDPDLGI